MFTETMRERQAVAWSQTTTINSGGTAAINTGNGMDMAELRRARAFLFIGAITGGGTITFQLEASAAVSSGYAAITNLTTNPTTTGITTQNSINALEISSDQMPTGTRYLRAYATETGGNNVVCTLLLLGDDSGYKPGRQFNIATLTNDVTSAT